VTVIRLSTVGNSWWIFKRISACCAQHSRRNGRASCESLNKGIRPELGTACLSGDDKYMALVHTPSEGVHFLLGGEQVRFSRHIYWKLTRRAELPLGGFCFESNRRS
jgi:hypothetical protein